MNLDGQLAGWQAGWQVGWQHGIHSVKQVVHYAYSLHGSHFLHTEQLTFLWCTTLLCACMMLTCV